MKKIFLTTCLVMCSAFYAVAQSDTKSKDTLTKKEISEMSPFEYIKRGAEGNGLPVFQYEAGRYYYNGEGGAPQDYAEAVKWFRKAAEQGLPVAEQMLGLCYQNGLGVAKDITKAVEWYRKSAEHGDMVGQYDLGACYYYGVGVKKDLNEAKRLFELSAAQGYDVAKEALKTYESNTNGRTTTTTANNAASSHKQPAKKVRENDEPPYTFEFKLYTEWVDGRWKTRYTPAKLVIDAYKITIEYGGKTWTADWNDVSSDDELDKEIFNDLRLGKGEKVALTYRNFVFRAVDNDGYAFLMFLIMNCKDEADLEPMRRLLTKVIKEY